MRYGLNALSHLLIGLLGKGFVMRAQLTTSLSARLFLNADLVLYP